MSAAGVTASEAGQHRLARRFFEEGATSKWSARPFEPKNGRERRALAACLAAGLVVRTDKDMYFVDAARYEAMQTRTRWALILAFAVVVILFAILYVTGEFNT